MFQAKHFNEQLFIFKEKYTQEETWTSLKQNGVLAVFSTVFYESTSWVWICFSSASYIMLKTKSTQRNSGGHSFLTFEHSFQHHRISKLQVRTRIYRPFPEARNSQTEWKLTGGDIWAEIRIEINQSKTSCVSWEVLLVGWKRNDGFKNGEWLHHWKSREGINSVNL